MGDLSTRRAGCRRSVPLAPFPTPVRVRNRVRGESPDAGRAGGRCTVVPAIVVEYGMAIAQLAVAARENAVDANGSAPGADTAVDGVRPGDTGKERRIR